MTKRVVVCGGGVIGACTAYYLSLLGVPPVVVERESVGCAASGKAGGFLALDWNDSSPVGALSRKSYELHQQLAATLPHDTGYRPVETLQVSASTAARRSATASKNLPGWIDGNISQTQVLGGPDTTAQVHPLKLTQALMTEAQSRGAQLMHGCVEGLVCDGNSVSGVVVDGQVVAADVVVLAMGPWTSAAQSWLPVPQITGQKYHSMVVKPAAPATAHCLFTRITTAPGHVVEPEIYPRSDGTIYMCGAPESVAVPKSASLVTVDSKLCDSIREATSKVSSAIAQAEVVATQACYLPLSEDGLPVIGLLRAVQGAYIASGHSCWGILNGPATGLALAELIVHGSSSIDLRRFDPARFD